MPGLLASPRRRRRLLWLVPPLVALVGLIVLAVALPRGGRVLPEVSTPTDAAGPEAVPVSKPLRVTSAVRREVNETLVPFVRHAVAREEPERAWPLATRALRTGTTRAQWARGELPVFPFPARVEEATGWRVIEAFEDDLLIDLVIHARPETKRGAMAFQIDLKPAGEGASRRWLVDAIIPQRAYADPVEGTKRAVGKARSDPLHARLGPIWFLVPAAILSLIVVVPVAVAVVSWRRGVRAERAYRRRLAERE